MNSEDRVRSRSAEDDRFRFTTFMVALVVIAGLVGLSLLSPAYVAEAQTPYADPIGTAYAFEQITVSSTAIGFTAATISPTAAPGAKSAYCTVEAQPIRVRESGTPTAAIGHPKVAGAEFVVQGINNLLTFRAIKSGATDATLTCTYFR